MRAMLPASLQGWLCVDADGSCKLALTLRNVCRCGDTVMAEPILDYGSVSVADWNEAQIKEEQVQSFVFI